MGHRKKSFWHNAKPLDIPKGAAYVPDAKVMLRASNDFFVAGAVWQRKDGQWRCVQTAPILSWMLTLSPAAAKLELSKRGCSWQWTQVGSWKPATS